MIKFTGVKPRGIAISEDGLRWVELDSADGDAAISGSAFEPVPAGTVEPNFAKENIKDRELFKKCLLKAIPEGKRRGDIALSLPDQLVRIVILDFDELPQIRKEAEKLILWRIKKMLPISTEEAHIDYCITGENGDKIQVLAAVAAKKVIREYEDSLREIGLRPILVDIASLNTLSLFLDEIEGDSIFVDISGGEAVGIALMADRELIFFRSKDLQGDIERVGQEIVSTLTYHKTRMPDLHIKRLYLACRQSDYEAIENGLKNVFEGEICRLSLTDQLKDGLPSDKKSAFSPAIGGAMRL
ncbi:MAG: pilus assembly protein PilM [Proteobacteria bacterium]|nr:pilus assembly protein PilM [Pseudomonadota bacterium]